MSLSFDVLAFEVLSAGRYVCYLRSCISAFLCRHVLSAFFPMVWLDDLYPWLLSCDALGLA